jgi:CRP-like cAMP-binding protein
MALFDKRSRSATAVAESDAELVLLPYKKLEAELSVMPEWVQVTLKSLSEKIRLSNQQLLRSQKKD